MSWWTGSRAPWRRPCRTLGTLQGRLATLINNHLDRENRPCSLVVEPGVVPHLLSDYNVRVPDLAVTCAPYQTEEAVLTDPVPLIEILSPSNQAKDLDQYLGVHQHSQRSGNSGLAGRSDRS